jgi:hypothetical protein
MPPPFVASTISTLLTTTAKPLVAKSLVASSVVRQQPYTNTTNKPVVTESAILNSFPRPNLQPTLYSTSSMFNLQMLKAMSPIPTSCFNCSGPHSTEFCPC